MARANKSSQQRRLTYLSQVMTPLIVGVIGVVGALAGAYMNSVLTVRTESKNRQLESEKFVLQKRIDLIDRTAKIIGRAPGISDIWENYLSKSIDEKTAQRISPPPELAEKLGDYKSEYESALLADSIFFGPDTTNAINELIKEEGPWWNKNKDKAYAVLAAMKKELYYDLPSYQRTK